MPHPRLMLSIASASLVVTVLLLFWNEGVLTLPSPKIDSSDNDPQIRIWRGECVDVDRPPTIPSPNSGSYKQPLLPYVQGTIRTRSLDYFASSSEGRVRISFSGGRGGLPWSYFSNCAEYYIDFSDLPETQVVRAMFRYYRDMPLADGQPRWIDPEPYEGVMRAIDGNKVVLESVREGDIYEIELTVEGLYKRLGIDEFGLPTMVNVAFLNEEVPEAILKGPDVLNEKRFVGGNNIQVFAGGAGQRTELTNAGINPGSQIVDSVKSDRLANVNRSLSIVLSTLLGLWIGIIFEALLVLTTLEHVSRLVGNSGIQGTGDSYLVTVTQRNSSR